MLSNDFIETFTEGSLLNLVLRTTIKKMSSCLLKRYNGLIFTPLMPVLILITRVIYRLRLPFAVRFLK